MILVGRSDLTPAQSAQIAALESQGSQVLHVKGDVVNLAHVENFKIKAAERFGPINGILHCAGVNRDAFVMKKTMEEMGEVIAPKIFGTLYLDEVFADESLDLFMLFSSTSSVFGNLGQYIVFSRI